MFSGGEFLVQSAIISKGGGSVINSGGWLCHSYFVRMCCKNNINTRAVPNSGIDFI